MPKSVPPTYGELETRVHVLEHELAMAKILAGRYESRNQMVNDLQNERAEFASKLYPHGLALHPDGHLYPIWMPTDDVVIRFDDKTGEERTPQQIGEMANAMRAVANMYNFDLKQWGSGDGFLKFAEGQLAINKKWDEHNGQV